MDRIIRGALSGLAFSAGVILFVGGALVAWNEAGWTGRGIGAAFVVAGMFVVKRSRFFA